MYTFGQFISNSGAQSFLGIRKQICKPWIARIELARTNRFMSTDLSQREALKRGCLSEQRRSYDWTNWSYNKGVSKPQKVCRTEDELAVLLDRWISAANKDELLEMITHGAEQIISGEQEHVVPYLSQS